MSFCPHVQQSTSLGSFLGLAEDDPDEGVNAGRVVLVALCPFRIRRFVEALSVCVSEGSSSIYTPRFLTLLVERYNLRLRSG